MKKLLGLLSVVLLVVLLVSCVKKEVIEWTPLEPSTPINTIDVIGLTLDKNEVSKNDIDVSKFSNLKITFLGTGSYPVPIDLFNFKVDDEEVDFTGVEGVTGTKPLSNHSFKVGNLDVVGDLVHNRKENLGIFHEGVLNINVENINKFYFELKITTNSYKYFEGYKLELSNVGGLK